MNQPHRTTIVPTSLLALLAVPALAPTVQPQDQNQDGVRQSVPDPGVVTTHQSITPAGVQAVFPGTVYALAFCSSDTEVAVAVNWKGIYRIAIPANRVVANYPFDSWFGTQGMACVPQTGELAVASSDPRAKESSQQVVLLPPGGDAAKLTVGSQANENETSAWQTAAKLRGTLGRGGMGGVGVAANSRVAVVALTGTNQIAVLDLDLKQITKHIQVSIAPFTAVVSADGTSAWVSNWGGRVPKANERTARTGDESEDRVLIDDRGIASSGTVSRVDLTAGRVTNEVAVGLHPTALAWDEKRGRLYVANGNSDSVSAVDTKSNHVVATWEIEPFVRRVNGIAPSALALAPDGARLYVACAGINAVAVLDTGGGTVAGLIPTAWYPNHIAVSPNGKTIAVSTMFGIGSGQLEEKSAKYFKEEQPDLQLGVSRRYVHSYRGTVHVIPVPEKTQLAAYTRAVAENSHLRLRADGLPATGASARPAALPVPERAGDLSLIEHVIYIVKENRAYDQLFGDLGRGNDDPSLSLYPEPVTPNHHKLAREFVTLDNFYATGGDSGDGHQWVTQASETDYTHWPGYDGRSYPFDGNDPIAYAKGGFLWDAVLKAGKTFADFGEFVPEGQYPELKKQPKPDRNAYRASLLQQWKDGDNFINRFNVSSPIAPLDAHLVRDYPSYGGTSPDVVRARIFLRHLAEWERSGTMPNLIYIQLPSDHTGGATPGYCTPKACLADNDLALGQIVEGVSHSKFWAKTVIFAVEDDAQGGVDHVDGHRTVALAVSPYIRRGSVDSTFYSHPSISKTAELMLGLPNLSIFDLIANDMRNSFTDKPDLTPYTAAQPEQSIFELNPPAQALSGQARLDALASARMNWTVPDAAPSEKLNRILWRIERGNVLYPGAKHAIFAPYSTDMDDDDRN